ncbi:MAG TPA: pseudouridine synthase [Phycisphaerae bacterium]|nr:pseudouridine synthase [Phycisphaerae bacterium]
MSRNSRRPRQKPPSAPDPQDRLIPDEDSGLDEGERRPRSGRTILYRDDSLIVLDKPPTVTIEDILAALSLAANDEAIGLGMAAAQYAYAAYPLDQGASGLLLVTASEELCKQCGRQISEQVLELRYWALIRGRPGQTSGTVSRRLLDNSAGGGLVRVDEEHGQPAVTDWRLLENYFGFALLECIPRTNVPCQIRAHLRAESMPLVVDPRYGGGQELKLSSFKADYRPSRRREERPLIHRLTLHAQSLTFMHPASGKQMRFELPPPKDMRATLHQLDRFGRMPP